MFAILVATQAWAQVGDPFDEDRPAGHALWVAHGESDSIRRAPDDTRGSYDALGVFINARRDRDRITAGLDADLEFRRYSLDELDDEQVGSVEAFADVAVIPERFAWVFEEDFGQGRTDYFAAAGPENRENISIFSTGPTLDVPFGGRTSLSLNALYSDRKQEETTSLDAESRAYELALFRQTGSSSRLGIVTDRNDVDYDTGLLAYTIKGAVLRYERDLATGDVLAEIGRNEMLLADSKYDGPRILLAWRRALGSRSHLGVTANQDFTDAGALFALEPIVSSATDVILTSSPLEQQRLELFYELESAKTNVSIGLAIGDDVFPEDASLDNRSSTARWSVRRRLTTRMSLGVTAENIRREFGGSTLEEGERLAEVFFDRQIGSHLVLQADFVTYERRGTNAFDEHRYEIRFRYESMR